MTLSMGKLDLPWTIGEHSLQIRDRNDRRVIDQLDDWDQSDFVDLYPEQAAYVVRAVNAHESAVGFLGSAAEELSHLAGLLDDAAGQDAVKLCGKIQHFLVAIR